MHQVSSCCLIIDLSIGVSNEIGRHKADEEEEKKENKDEDDEEEEDCIGLSLNRRTSLGLQNLHNQASSMFPQKHPQKSKKFARCKMKSKCEQKCILYRNISLSLAQGCVLKISRGLVRHGDRHRAIQRSVPEKPVTIYCLHPLRPFFGVNHFLNGSDLRSPCKKTATCLGPMWICRFQLASYK